MTDTEIFNAIQADSQASALAASGNDAGCAARLVAVLPPVPTTGRLVTDRGVIDAFTLAGNPADGDAALRSFASAAAAQASTNPLLTRVNNWLSPSQGGLDFGNPATLATIDSLHTAGVFTDAQAATLKAIGLMPVAVSAADVSRAMLPHRPNGKV